jgi:hypothetical protein
LTYKSGTASDQRYCQQPDVDAARSAETMNSVFRVYKYPVTYSAFSGKTMTAGAVIEL